MTSPEQQINLLRLSVESAKARLQNANEMFSEVMRDIPSGLPAPDGTLRIKNAGTERAAARAELQSALAKLNALIFDQSGPADSPTSKSQARGN